MTRGRRPVQGDEVTPATREFGRLVSEGEHNQYVLKLYVTGMTPRSQRAILNSRKICEEYLTGRYSLEIVDLFQHPTLAEGEQIIAVPTLLKQLPEPLRRIVGDLSDTEHVLVGLDLQAKP